MKRWIGRTPVVVLALATLVVGTLVVSAQQREGAGDRGAAGRRGDRAGGEAGAQRGDRGQRMGDRQFDPAQMRERMAEMRERMLEDMREPLGFAEADWTAVKPLIADVVEKQFAGGTNRFRGMFGGRGGRGGRGERGDRPGSTDEPPSEIDQLRTTLDNESASADEIKAKLKALRDARQKQEAELKAAREKLRAVLTVRQEATLVVRGILD